MWYTYVNEILQVISIAQKMQCTWPSSEICQKIFKAIQHTNTTVNMTFDEHGLHIMSMDSSHTSLVRLELQPQFFSQWKCPTPLTLGIQTEILLKWLLVAKKSQITWHIPNDTLLNITFEKEGRVTSLSMRAIDIDTEVLAIGDLEDDVYMVVENTIMKEWMDTVMMTKGDIRFKINSAELTCSSSSVEFGEITVKEPLKNLSSSTFRKEVDIAINHNGGKSFAIYSACGPQCHFGISNEQPSHLKVILDDHHSYIEYFIAPKMED